MPRDLRFRTLTMQSRRMYHEVVRRALAIALLGLFCISLIPPSAFAWDPEAGLPACCRRNGKHHCSLMMGGSHGSGAALQSRPCRFFPNATRVTALPNAGVPATPLVTSVSLPSSYAGRLATETQHPVVFHSPRQQRGPPAFFLS